MLSFLSNPVFQNIIGSLFRHLLTVSGGALAAKGIMESGTLDQIIGGVMATMGTFWGAANKAQEPVEPLAPAKTKTVAKATKRAG